MNNIDRLASWKHADYVIVSFFTMDMLLVFLSFIWNSFALLFVTWVFLVFIYYIHVRRCRIRHTDKTSIDDMISLVNKQKAIIDKMREKIDKNDKSDKVLKGKGKSETS